MWRLHNSSQCHACWDLQENRTCISDMQVQPRQDYRGISVHTAIRRPTMAVDQVSVAIKHCRMFVPKTPLSFMTVDYQELAYWPLRTFNPMIFLHSADA